MRPTNRPLSYARANRPRFVAELKEFVRFPSISAQPKQAGAVKQCALWLADHLRRLKPDQLKVFATARHPIVYAAWRQAPGRPTVLIYGHYDVQPADPLNAWHTPPFQPVVRNNNLFGRGASDDKGQLFTHVKAIEAYVRTDRRLPVNVTCLFEGEEEIGSPNLKSFLENNRRRMACDVAVISDMRILGPNRPALTYALRGALNLEIEVTGPKQDLHSGTFGGAVHNPIQALCEIIARLHDRNGRIAIPGFYHRVRRWSDEERAFMKRMGYPDARILKNACADRGWGERGFSLYERTTIRPALSVTGFTGGYQGPGNKSVIPTRARATFNFRLVPDQDPRELEQLFRRHLAQLAPPTIRASVRTQMSTHPVYIDRKHPMVGAAATAYRHGFGAAPAYVRSGGTIPVAYVLQKVFGVPVVLMGFALPDDRLHAPNEKFHLPTFFKGIATSIWFLHTVGTMRGITSQRMHRHRNQA